jgi:hypothetical protein
MQDGEHARRGRWGGFGLRRSADLDLHSGDEDRWRRPWVEQTVRGGNRVPLLHQEVD